MNGSELMLFVVKVLAGTGVFLVGVHLLTSNVEQLATEKIKRIFNKTADKRLTNVAIGTAATALIQSSGVTTVLIVGFVNVGIVNLRQATAMIMGANVGTTVTAQIAALSAFPVTTYVQVCVFAGILMTMLCKDDDLKKAGLILSGFGLIFVGLSVMSDAMKVNSEAIQALFENVKNPFLLFAAGIFLTALVQSSSATTSIIIAMSVAGLTIGTGGNEVLYVILGTNVGSCVTALLSSLTAGTNARRAGIIHLLFNVFGSAAFFTLLMLRPDFMRLTFGRWFESAATQIAMFHTFFNVSCTLIFLPFCDVFVKLSETLIRDRRPAQDVTHLDDRILASPSLAVSQLENETLLLADTAMEAFRTAYRSFDAKDKQLIEMVQAQIEKTHALYHSILSYLIRLSTQSGQLSDERRISNVHSNVSDIMRIAEIADNFTKYTRTSIKNGFVFSVSVREGISDMINVVEELYALMKQIVSEKDASLLSRADALEDTIDAFRRRLIDEHVERLNAGACKPESSAVFINLVSNVERLGDHLTYIIDTVR